MPGHSPGARIQNGTATSSLASRCDVLRVAAAYSIRDGGGLLGELLDGGGLLDDVVADGGQRAVTLGAEPDVLDGRRAVADDGEHLLPGERQLDRAPARTLRPP